MRSSFDRTPSRHRQQRNCRVGDERGIGVPACLPSPVDKNPPAFRAALSADCSDTLGKGMAISRTGGGFPARASNALRASREHFFRELPCARRDPDSGAGPPRQCSRFVPRGTTIQTRRSTTRSAPLPLVLPTPAPEPPRECTEPLKPPEGFVRGPPGPPGPPGATLAGRPLKRQWRNHANPAPQSSSSAPP